MVRDDKAAWKSNYFVKLVQLFEEYPKCFMVSLVLYKNTYLVYPALVLGGIRILHTILAILIFITEEYY